MHVLKREWNSAELCFSFLFLCRFTVQDKAGHTQHGHHVNDEKKNVNTSHHCLSWNLTPKKPYLRSQYVALVTVVSFCVTYKRPFRLDKCKWCSAPKSIHLLCHSSGPSNWLWWESTMKNSIHTLLCVCVQCILVWKEASVLTVFATMYKSPSRKSTSDFPNSYCCRSCQLGARFHYSTACAHNYLTAMNRASTRR